MQVETQVFDSEKLPSYQDLDENLYSMMTRQIEYQKNTINLLNLQLKQKSSGDFQKNLAEKDKIIASLNQKLSELDSDFSEKDKKITKLMAENEELELEVLDLQAKLKEKNETNRKIEKQYNEHLNKLNEQLLKAQDQNVSKELVKENEDLKKEIQIVKTQLKLLQTKQQKEEVNLVDHEQQELIDSLNSEILNLKNQVYNEERLLVENETLRKKLELLEVNVNKAPVRQSKEDLLDDFLKLDSLMSLYEAYESSDIKHIEKTFSDMFAQLGVKAFNSVGEEFDSIKHHISEIISSVELPHNCIFKQNSKGFMLDNEVIKKASVILVRNPLVCKGCNTLNIKESRFCSHCGSKLNISLDSDTSDSENLLLNNSQNVLAYIDLGEVYLEKKEFQMAKDAFNKAFILDPNSLDAAFGIIKVEEMSGNFAACLEALDNLKTIKGTKKMISKTKQRIEDKKIIIDTLKSIC